MAYKNSVIWSWKPQIWEISRLKVTIWTYLLIGLRPSILADGYIPEPLKSKTFGQSAGELQMT